MILELLPSKFNLPAKDSREDHLDVLDETIVAVVVAVQANLVRIDDRVIVLRGNLLHWSSVALSFLLRHILADHLVLQAVLQRCGTRNSRSQLQHIPIILP